MKKDWVGEKVDKSNINRGKEYTLDDNLELSAINSIVKNSIYASEIADEVLNKINNFNPELATEYVTQTEFKETKNDLLSKIQVNTNRITTLNEGVASNTESINDLQEQINTLNVSPEEITGIKNDINTIKNDTIPDLTQQVASMNGQVSANTESINELEQNYNIINEHTIIIGQNKSNIQKNADEIEQLKEDIGNISISPEEIAGLKSEVNQATEKVSELDNKVTGIDEKVDGFDTRINNNATKIEENTLNISKNASAIENNKTSIQQNATNISKNTEDIQNLDQKITDLEIPTEDIENLKQALEDIQQIKDDVEQNKTNISTNSQGIQQNSSDIQKNTGDIQTLTNTVNTFDGRITQNSSDIQSNKNSINSHSTQIENINNRLDNLAVTPEDIKKLQQSVDNLSNEIPDIKSDIESNANGISQNKGIIDGHSETLTQQNERITQLDGKISDNTDLINKNAQDIAGHTNDISDINLRIDNLDLSPEDVADLKANVDQFSEDIGNLQESVTINTSNIASNTERISTNSSNIETNRVAIESNSQSIANNASNISKNTSDISKNSAEIANLKEKIKVQIIRTGELPIANKDSADIVQLVNQNGQTETYIKKLFINDFTDSNLTNTIWYLNSSLGKPSYSYDYNMTYNVQFINNSNIYSGIRIVGEFSGVIRVYYGGQVTYLASSVNAPLSVLDENYRMIQITSGDVTNSGLISWLKNNSINLVYKYIAIQDKLVSGENVKTFNGESIFGSGDIEIPQIEINNGQPATATANTISVNGENFAFAGGGEGGGSSVEINSIDTPVGVANFIKVNGLNYEIAGGSGVLGGNWIDGKFTPLIVETGSLTSVNIDLSNIILDYDENAEYEGIFFCGLSSAKQVGLYLGSDIITEYEVARSVNGPYHINTVFMPFKRYINYKTTRTDGLWNYIYLVGYRKVGANNSTASQGSSLPIGSIFASALPQTDAGVHLLDGSTIALDGIYKDFVNRVKSLVNAGYNLTCSQEEYDAYVSATGSCGKFVLDETNNTLRLPVITTFVQGLTDLTNIGSSVEAGLPNITGTEGSGRGGDFTGISGAFSQKQNTSAKDLLLYYGASSSTSLLHQTFDASLSNPIYGNSETVQPPSIVYPYYIVLANMGGNGSSASNQNVYSTEEQAIGVWIDGKTIYRKVFTGTFGSAGNNIMGYIQDIKTLVNSYGYYIKDKYLTPINTYFDSNMSSIIQIDNTNGQILACIGNSLAKKEYTYTFEYTKTTD